MNEFELLLQNLDEVLQRKNLQNYQRLNEPLPEDKRDEFFRELDILDHNFATLFSWKNGYDLDIFTKERCQICQFGSFFSLRFIAHSIAINKKEPMWGDYFIPILGDTAGDSILFCNKKGRTYGKLYLFSVSLLHTDPVGYFDSLSSMVETIIEAYQQDALTYSAEENWLNVNTGKYWEIASNINKHSKYWTIKKWP